MILKLYLVRHRITIKQFSEQLGYSRHRISQIATGNAIPGKLLAKEIERITNGEVKAKDLLALKPIKKSVKKEGE